MKTVVLDDDPTGTQSATGVRVLLRWDAERLSAALADVDAVYLQTNSRAVDEAAAVALCHRIREQIGVAAERLGEPVQVVLRGDSTLRGHVFAETDVFVTDEPILFLPAFPAGGRVTVDGTHYVEVDGRRVSAEQTEYAQDPVFGFGHGDLVGYVREQGNRDAVTVPLAAVRETRGRAVADALLAASAGVVVAPDAETDADVDLVHAGLRDARERGGRVVVRCAAPLAARCAGVASRGLLVARWRRLAQRYAHQPVPRPAGWLGYRLVPKSIELWTRHADRLHHRELFVRTRRGWKRQLLQP